MVFVTAHQIKFSHHSNNRILYCVLSVAVVFALSSSATWAVTRAWAGPVTSREVIVVDTDPGTDDALALLTLLGDLEVQIVGVTCVRGNTGVPNVAVNALKVLKVAGRPDVPVYSGHNYGLVESPSTDNWFGEDGMGDEPFLDPPTSSDIQEEHAAAFLARVVRENPGEITIIAIGPLTNLALALHLNPDFLRQAKRVVILGGSIRGLGNISPGVEFNFYLDPAAASVVMDRASTSDAVITLVPMETCMDHELTQDWRWKTLATINNTAVTFLNALEKSQLRRHPSPRYHPMDLYAVSAALWPDFVLHSQEVFGQVEHKGDRAQGALLVDHRNITGNRPNLEIILEVNVPVLRLKVLENLANLK